MGAVTTTGMWLRAMHQGTCWQVFRRLASGMTAVMSSKSNSPDCPFELFSSWYEIDQGSFLKKLVIRLQDIIHWVLGVIDPGLRRIHRNNFTLATYDTQTQVPSARVLLLKSYSKEGFVFYTNYDSEKGKALESLPRAQILFYSIYPLRQIRIFGNVQKVPRQTTLEYWNTRPRGSQLSQWVSHQSHPIQDRQQLLEAIEKAKEKFGQGPIPCPENWGGYCLIPEKFEFWVGRADRLHDRLVYKKSAQGGWDKLLLAP